MWICSDDENICFYKRGRPFRFEAMWMKDKCYKGVIKSTWEGYHTGCPMSNLVTKVDSCRKKIADLEQTIIWPYLKPTSPEEKASSPSRGIINVKT